MPEQPAQRTESPADVVRAFIDCINRHDVPGLTRLMSDEHVFIDSLGAVEHGKERMRKAWIGYFFLIPDYTIAAEELIQSGESVAAFGTANGTLAFKGELRKENRWEIPVAIRAIVRDGLVAGWQVYADNEPVRKIMASQPA